MYFYSRSLLYLNAWRIVEVRGVDTLVHAAVIATGEERPRSFFCFIKYKWKDYM